MFRDVGGVFILFRGYMIDLTRIPTSSPVHKLRGNIEYRFELRGIPGTTIHVRVFEREGFNGTEWEYTCSHWIKTPTQFGVYTPSAPFATSQQGAIEKAMRDYATFYSGAVSAGHEPDSSWFVPGNSWDE